MSKLSKIAALAGFSLLPFASLAQPSDIPALTDKEMSQGQKLTAFSNCVDGLVDTFKKSIMYDVERGAQMPDQTEQDAINSHIYDLCGALHNATPDEFNQFTKEMDQKYPPSWKKAFD